jgi:hypothetical protein
MKTKLDKPYRVVVRRDPEDARFWLADVNGLDGAHTSSRSLATLNRYVREVIVLVAELPDDAEDQLELDWDYRTGDPAMDKEARRLRSARAALDEAQRALAEDTAELVRQLVVERGFSVREAAALLAVSPARVDQLVQKPRSRRIRRGRAA